MHRFARPIRPAAAQSRTILALALTATVLAGCGGGGGGGTTAPTTGGTGTTGVMNADIAKNVFAGVITMTGHLWAAQQVSPQIKALGSAAGQSAAPAATASPSLMYEGLFGSSQTATGQDDGLHAKAATTNTTSCALGGRIDRTVTDGNGDGLLSSGDSIVATYVTCIDGAGFTYSGGVTYTDIVSQGVAGTVGRTYGLKLRFASYRVSSLTSRLTYNGDFTVIGTLRNLSPGLVDLTGKTGAFVINGATRTATFNSFAATATFDPSAGVLTTTIPAAAIPPSTLGLTSVSPLLTVSTSVPLTQTGVNRPTAGVLVIRATDGSQARITATAASTATIEIDADGDGTFESSSTVPWDDMYKL